MSEPNVPPPPPTAPAGGSSNKTAMLVLAYLGLLALVPLLVEKDDKEVQWHAKHGLVLLAAFFIASVAMTILGFIPGVGCVLLPLHFVLWIGYLIVIVMGIVKATNGQRLILPFVSDFANKF
jgi:uncharacterized membrane protein